MSVRFFDDATRADDIEKVSQVYFERDSEESQTDTETDNSSDSNF